nr:hypothetical protein BgiMline_019386 [Biomphalaria glabrata]
MDGKKLNLCYTSPCEYNFNHVTCEAMGTYYCGSRPGDVIVFNCPPQLMKSDQTVRVELGDSVNVSVDVLLALNHQLTVLYQKQNAINKCGTKLCIQTSETRNKWRQQIKIVINNITTQDMGNQTFTMCSNFKADSFCTNMTITILPLHEPDLCAENVKVNDYGPDQKSVSWSHSSAWESYIVFYANSKGQWMSYLPANITKLANGTFYSTSLPTNIASSSTAIKVAANLISDHEFCDNIPNISSPVLSPTEAVVTTNIGKSLTVSVNVTMSKKVSAVSVYYQTHKQETKLCGPKLCVKEKLNKNWRRLITIKIANITDQDIGTQTIQICSRKGAELLCSNLTLKVVLSENRLIKAKAKVPSLNVNQTSVTRPSTSLPGFKVQKVHSKKLMKEKLKKKERKQKEQRNKLKQKEPKKLKRNKFVN